MAGFPESEDPEYNSPIADPYTAIQQSASYLWDLHTALIREGFSGDQAMQIVVAGVQGGSF